MNALYTKIVELISLNKGIVWGDNSFHEQFFCLQFSVTDSRTRLLIHFVSEASNTKLDRYARSHPGELEAEVDPDRELIYEYRSNTDGDIDMIDQVSWLGAHFTWAMFKMGVISANEEQHFCSVFGADSKSV